MIDASAFVAYFPEFRGDETEAHLARLALYIARAIERTPGEVWGGLTDQGVLYLAAHLLAISPYGVNAKLASKEGKSVYGQEREHLARIVVSGGRVVGYGLPSST